MILNHKQSITNTLLTVSDPTKNENLHYSTIQYADEELRLQFKVKAINETKMQIRSDNTVKMFDSLISNLVDHISDNSEKFFRGKKFSRDKIQNSICNIYEVNEKGEAFINVKNNYDCTDYYYNCIPFSELSGTCCEALVVIRGLTYIKSVINVDFCLQALKQDKVKKSHSNDPLFSDDIPETKQDTDNMDFF